MLPRDVQLALIKRVVKYAEFCGVTFFESKNVLLVLRAQEDSDGVRTLTILLSNGKYIAMRADAKCCSGDWNHGYTGVASGSSQRAVESIADAAYIKHKESDS